MTGLNNLHATLKRPW